MNRHFASLRAVSPEFAGKSWESKHCLRIGRSQQAEVSITDKSISRSHAEVVFTTQGWVVRDLRSRNGTFLNGIRVGQVERRLQAHDLLQCGNVVFCVTALVDDAPDLGLVVTLLGRRAGCEVECRLDVPGAWEFLQHTRPDLILLDRNLPGVSGLELCRRVRATPALADLPIALFVYLRLTEDVAAGLEAGVDFLFSKELVGSPDEWRPAVSVHILGLHLPRVPSGRRQRETAERGRCLSG